jgi:short-subunit dehydrogenase
LANSIKDMNTLRGKTALITGASRGIGIHIAKALANQGMNLVLVARNAESLKKTSTVLKSSSVKIFTVAADVGNINQLSNLVDEVDTLANGIDILINNAGIDVCVPYHEMKTDDIDQIIKVNLIAPMILSKLFLPKMIERGEGHIVNIASLSGLVGTPYEEAYTASKHGLVGFSRSLRITAMGESYPVGISVICPGFISDTGMWFDVERDADLKAPSAIGTSSPEKVAKAVVSAITKNKLEVIVNPTPIRPLLLLQSLFPSIAPWLTQKTGTIQLMKKVAYHYLNKPSST